MLAIGRPIGTMRARRLRRARYQEVHVDRALGRAVEVEQPRGGRRGEQPAELAAASASPPPISLRAARAQALELLGDSGEDRAAATGRSGASVIALAPRAIAPGGAGPAPPGGATTSAAAGEQRATDLPRPRRRS